MLAFFVVTDTEGYEMYLEISSMQELNSRAGERI